MVSIIIVHCKMLTANNRNIYIYIYIYIYICYNGRMYSQKLVSTLYPYQITLHCVNNKKYTLICILHIRWFCAHMLKNFLSFYLFAYLLKQASKDVYTLVPKGKIYIPLEIHRYICMVGQRICWIGFICYR